MHRFAIFRPLLATVLCLAATGRAPAAVVNPLSTSAAAINTTGYEDSPFLTADGTALYFMYTPWSIWPTFFGGQPVLLGPERPNHHINPDRNPWEDSDVYVAYQQPDGTWSAPQNLGFNDAQADCCAMTWNGALFAYQRTQAPNSPLTDIYFVERQSDGRWVRTSAGPGVNTATASESNPHLTADGAHLFFTSDRRGGFGRNDLYVSDRLGNGAWGPARNLGPTFNTAENEDQIWVSRDGRTIYFNREPGPEILVSTYGNGAWSIPVAVEFGGMRIAAAEASLTDDGTRIVFAQVRPDLQDIVIVTARRQDDGTWSAPVPIECDSHPSACVP